MIPKQLFFIWIGDNKPNYVDFAVNAFKKVNPDFKVDLLEWKIKDIENLNIRNEYDKCLYDCIFYILNNEKYTKAIIEYKSYPNRKFIIMLADILRLELLYRFGGIYLDCDTFPNKPFDDKLLNNDSFCCNSFTSYDNEYRHPDSYFLGCIKYKFVENFYFYNKKIDTTKYHYYENEDWIRDRKLFFECKLNYKYNDVYYINHFIDRTWLNNKIQKCKYDR